MKTSILRMSIRASNGVRRWIVPGYSNCVRVIPASKSNFGTLTVQWPAKDHKGELVRGARLDWHKPIIRAAITELLKKKCGA
jgi:hypothetical protein